MLVAPLQMQIKWVFAGYARKMLICFLASIFTRAGQPVGDTGEGFWLKDRHVSSWGSRVPDGTFVMDPWIGPRNADNGRTKYGSKRFIFGCRLDKAYINNYAINKGKCSDFSSDSESWRFGGVISMYGNDLFVGNNVMTKISSSKDNRLCLDINKQLLAGFKTRCAVATNEGLYGTNVVVKGNWFYNRGNKSYEISGKWAIIKDNIANKDYLGGTPYFNTCVGGDVNSDYMNRAFDMGGHNVWVDNNEYHNTGSGGNDGEGILGQRHNEVEIFSHVWSNNFGGPKSSGRDKGYIAPYDMHCIGFMLYKNKTEYDGGIGIHKPQYSSFADLSIVDNDPGGGLAISGLDDLISSCPSSSPSAPTDVSVSDNGDGSYTIEWTDNATNEIGFRVDRRVNGGAAHTIVFRPRNSDGGDALSYNPSGGGGGYNPGGYCETPEGFDFNEQKWIDYMCPVDATVEYRVIAMNCANNTDGASAWTSPDPVIIAQTEKDVFSVYPNPADDHLIINGVAEQRINLYDLTGNKVLTATSGSEVDVSALSAGVYILELSKKQAVHKLIIK